MTHLHEDTPERKKASFGTGNPVELVERSRICGSRAKMSGD